ncbi:UNKNOWN [Stylonychia lemnae]|uniref:Uncharacterized protein n=1 Tax=Stylonychia lemnae TaxID=5949 RepID=A0A078AMR4_STYLE|nr:UNKNOWN [Stylonychia lemnae]|eukprot:CDW83685.1 UNKNOWN [Stylonychia lemnae]
MYHSLSSTFMPQSLFFLIVNSESVELPQGLTQEQQKEELLNIQMKIWLTPQTERKISLQRAAINQAEYFCQKIPDCVNLICQYLKELLIFSISDKIEVNSHPFLSHFAHTILLSRLPIYSRIYAALACIQIVYPHLKTQGLKEQMQLIQEAVFAAANSLIEYPMPLIKLIFLIVSNTLKEEIFIDTNKYRYGPIIKLIFSQQLLKECPNVSEVITMLLDYFEKNTLKYMMQLIIDNSMQVVENAKDCTSIFQLVNLNKRWRQMVQDEPNLRQQVNLNYFPVVQASTLKFLQIVENNFKVQQQLKEQQRKLGQKKGSTAQAVLDVSQNPENQLNNLTKTVDKALLSLLRACCFNLQPQIDNQQFIEIEKKLMPLFRQMVDDLLQPYQIQLLKVAEAIVVVKKQLTPTTSFALKNLHFIFEQSFSIKRIKSLIIFLAFGQDFYKMNSQILVQASLMCIKLLSTPELIQIYTQKDVLDIFIMIQVMHINHYNVELQFNIAQLLDTLMDLKGIMDKECRVQRVLAILSLSHNYIQQMFDYFGSKDKRSQLVDFIMSDFSAINNQSLTNYEIKIFVCGISNLFLRYREQYHLNLDEELFPVVIRSVNMLFWQKYIHDKKVYFDLKQPLNPDLINVNQKNQIPSRNAGLKDDDDECLSEFFLSEYRDICSESLDDMEERKEAEKYYKDTNIIYKDYDEYIYFKKYLVNSFFNDKDTLKSFLLQKNKRISRMVEMVLRCKRVRITRDGGREFIRFIFNFSTN